MGPGRRDTDEFPIHVVVGRDRRLVQPARVRIHRRRNFEENVQWNLRPPRIRYEHAAIDVATSADTEFATVAALAQSVQLRRTTAGRMLDALEDRDRVPRRQWVAGVLQDIAAGTCSVLERGYLTRVERPHRLPRAQRQAIGTGRTGRVYRDASYEVPLLVELDSRLFHDSAGARDRDFDRDLLAQVDGRLTDPALLGSGLRSPVLDGRAGRRTAATARLDRLSQAVVATNARYVVDRTHEVKAIHHAGVGGVAGAPGGGRTHTVRCLRPLPLPIGIPGRGCRDWRRASRRQVILEPSWRPAQDGVEHRLGEPAGEGVLLRGVVAAEQRERR